MINTTIPNTLFQLINGGESISVEFKESHKALNKDVYDTVCSFSNRNGGHIFLGVKNNSEIIGIEEDCIEKIKKQFVETINNTSKMYPPLYLTPVMYEIDGKKILYIYVPESNEVCRCAGKIWDRNEDADIDITNHADEVYRLYSRKRGSYFVNKVTRFGLEDLRPDLIERARRMTRYRDQNHPWFSMSDEEMLRSSNLILKDDYEQIEGVTYAGILLFGKDSTIMSILPQHKTDAIFRVVNTDRYDDRDVVITNLIESYDRLMAFGKKHLNDTFHLEGIQSVSARDHILREIISNLLVHRDFSSAYVPKLIIEKDKIVTENGNLSHGYGALNPISFEPISKNPPIAKVFREIGLADELGSGMRNTYKYTKMYSGQDPQFVEGDVFRITVPIPDIATATVGPEGQSDAGGTRNGTRNGTQNGTRNSVTTDENVKQTILKLIDENQKITIEEISQELGISVRTLKRKFKTIDNVIFVGKGKNGHWEIISDDK